MRHAPKNLVMIAGMKWTTTEVARRARQTITAKTLPRAPEFFLVPPSEIKHHLRANRARSSEKGQGKMLHPVSGESAGIAGKCSNPHVSGSHALPFGPRLFASG